MIKILLVERNVILLDHLKEKFNQDKQLNVVSICKEGNQVMEFLKKHPVDIVLMDHLQINGLVITAQITKEFPTIKIIGFSTYEKGLFNNRMLELGASSYLSKYETNINELITEIKIFPKTT